MDPNQPMNGEMFTRRLISLCLRSGLTAFPKDGLDQHILLKSAALVVGSHESYTEKEINERLQLWLLQVCPIKNFDHITLRRWLVDLGYLKRSPDGSSYQVARPGPRPELFSSEVEQIDVAGVIAAGKEEIERRKREYMQRAGK